MWEEGNRGSGHRGRQYESVSEYSDGWRPEELSIRVNKSI